MNENLKNSSEFNFLNKDGLPKLKLMKFVRVGDEIALGGIYTRHSHIAINSGLAEDDPTQDFYRPKVDDAGYIEQVSDIEIKVNETSDTCEVANDGREDTLKIIKQITGKDASHGEPLF